MSNNGLCGLKNFGNSCWLNSSIQCIIASDYVSNFFVSEKGFLSDRDVMTITIPEEKVLPTGMVLNKYNRGNK